jgi:hypothetical protein
VKPAMPGNITWKVVSPFILRVESDIPLPNSTKFTVTVPAGINSYLGDSLEKETSQEFVTPTIRVTQLQPSSGLVTLNPVFIAVFDQVIDQEEVLKCVSIYTEGILGNDFMLPYICNL